MASCVFLVCISINKFAMKQLFVGGEQLTYRSFRTLYAIDCNCSHARFSALYIL